MGPVVALSAVWRRGLTFHGRSSRPEYWWYALFYVLTLGGLGFGTLFFSQEEGAAGLALVAFLGPALILTVPYFAVGVRRLHDIGRSGWWLSVPLALAFIAEAASGPTAESDLGKALQSLAALSNVALVVFMAMPGEPGPNKFGEPPAAGAKEARTNDGAGEHTADADHVLYEQIGRELKEGDYEPAAWAEAVADGGGEVEIRSRYARLRLTQLRRASGR